MKRDIPQKSVLMNTIMSTISMAWNIDNKVHEKNITNWLNNFTGAALSSNGDDEVKMQAAREAEQQIALFMLCNFVFYNENEVKHLTRLMLEKYIHNCFETDAKHDVDDDCINDLLSATQFTPLGQASESSSYLLYHFRQENDLAKNNFAIRDNVNNIVFVDDFSITGNQAKLYISDFMAGKREGKVDNKFLEYVRDKHFYVLLMVATDVAVSELSSIKNLTILPCIVMDDKSKVFSDSSIVFDGYNNEYKQNAQKICEYYGKNLYKEALGYKNGGYLFGSYYNIPDNTLPIFWSDRHDWNYLFKRYDKKYNMGAYVIGGRYV